METKILLTPKQVSDLTGIDLLKCVLIAFPDQRGCTEKEAKKIGNCTFELTEFVQFSVKGTVIIEDGQCMLREVIRSVNTGFTNFLRRAISDNSTVKNIALSGKLQSFLPILTPENRQKLYTTLAERHRLAFGNNTREYNNYQLLTSKTPGLCVHQ